MTELKSRDAHGADVVTNQLIEAEAGWQGIKLSNYEKLVPQCPASSTPEPDTKHPAHQVFKASDLGPEWDRTPPQ